MSGFTVAVLCVIEMIDALALLLWQPIKIARTLVLCYGIAHAELYWWGKVSEFLID
jgi:hypothetical protein